MLSPVHSIRQSNLPIDRLYTNGDRGNTITVFSPPTRLLSPGASLRGCRPDRWAIRIENAACLRKHLHEAEPSFDSAHPLYAGREVLSHDDSEAFVMRIALAAGSERLFEPPSPRYLLHSGILPGASLRGCRTDRRAIRIENAACLRKHFPAVR